MVVPLGNHWSVSLQHQERKTSGTHSPLEGHTTLPRRKNGALQNETEAAKLEKKTEATNNVAQAISRSGLHKRGCCDTIEGSASDEGLLQRRNSRNQRESRNCTMTHLQQHSCHFLRVLVSGANRWCMSVQWCDITSEFDLNTLRSTGLKNSECTRDPMDNFNEAPCPGRNLRGTAPGYAGVRLGEARNPGPVEHERDHAEEPSARRTRICEAGDAVPGSHDSITRGVRNLHLADVPAAHAVPVVRAPPTMPNTRRPTQQRSRRQTAFLQCAQCGEDPHAYTGHADCGLMEHMSQKHGGQTLTQENVAQLRELDRAACVICGGHPIAPRKPLQSLPN